MYPAFNASQLYGYGADGCLEPDGSYLLVNCHVMKDQSGASFLFSVAFLLLNASRIEYRPVIGWNNNDQLILIGTQAAAF